MLAAIILVVNFMLPKKIVTNAPDIVTYGFEIGDYQKSNTMDELKAFVEQGENIVGVAFDNGSYTVIANNFSEKQAAAIILPLLDQAPNMTKVVVFQTEGTISPPPFNKHCLPVFICFEAIVQGFLLAGVLMLNEKSGKIVRTLQVSPLLALQYWTAKIILFSVVGTLYALLMVVFTVGFSLSIVPFIVVSMLASATFTMLGMITAVFFRSLNNWFMLTALILGVNMLTMFAYVFPSLSFPFMRLLPSYPYIFIYEQILLGSFELTSNSVSILVWLIALCVASIVCIKLRFLKPQKAV